MNNSKSKEQEQLAIRIVSATGDSERAALKLWIERLLAIKGSNVPALRKSMQAISVTGGIVLPTAKVIAREVKRHAWDNRSVKGRFGLGGAAVGIALFGGESAGIAALGSAIGVPLWVIFGTGATFLGVLYEEITGSKPNPKTTYQEIEAEREDED